MLETTRQVIAIIFVLIGTIFSIVGALGYIRLPDVYTRLHAVGKVSVFGVTLLLLGAVAVTPLGLGKALILVIFLVVAGPAASHAIASAAYRSGKYPPQVRRDDLKEYLHRQSAQAAESDPQQEPPA